MSRNPDWTTDELILALELFFRHGRKQLGPEQPDVISLSEFLNTLPIHDPSIRNSKFRNSRGVSMKLGNFLRLDPTHQGAGLSRGSELDKVVWDEFSNDQARLKETADAIRRTTKQVAEKGEQYIYHQPDDEDDAEFPEGKLLSRLHVRKERNRQAVEQRKRKVLAKNGTLVCEVCDFDFAAVYGDLGKGFAECHHLVPIAKLEENHRTRLEDLAIVCANCHRMLHRSRPMLTIAQLRGLVKQGAC